MPENTTHESPAYEKRGYLNHEFRLFHLRGQMDTPVAYHYHDFHKVLILLNGEADYIVEGRSYHLRPLDEKRLEPVSYEAEWAQAGRAIRKPI